MKFEIRKSNNPAQPYYWRIVADNGEPLAHSETYVSKADCQTAINIIAASAATAEVDDLT